MCVNECKYESCFYSKTQDNFYATKRKKNFQTADEKNASFSEDLMRK